MRAVALPASCPRASDHLFKEVIPVKIVAVTRARSVVTPGGSLVRFVVVPTVVPESVCVVVGAPMFAQSSPASPPVLTSSVLAGTVGFKAP